MEHLLLPTFLIFLGIIFLIPSAYAASDMFLKLDQIGGESTDKAHKGEIDVLAWSWGMSNSGTTHIGGGAGAGKANFQDISITKYVDKSSPALMLHAATGAHIADGTLVVRKAGTTKPIEYEKITMTNILVTRISTGGSGGEDRLTENISLNFNLVKDEYTQQNPDGSAGSPITFCWDIIFNTICTVSSPPPAPAGSFNDPSNGDAITPCPAGTFTDTVGQSACTPAPEGSYVDTTGATSATLCPVGFFATGTGNMACTPAPEGSYVGTTGAASATLCPAGTFSSGTGNSACTQAPAGSYTGGTGFAAPTICPAGTYCPNPGTVTPLACPVGDFCAEGSVTPDTPPTISITSPTNNEIVNTSTPTISGSASDDTLVSSISWKIDSGSTSTVSGIVPATNIIWSFGTSTLSPGHHTIQVNATDPAGLVTTSSVSITYAAPTATLPPPSGTGQMSFNTNSGGFTNLNSITPSSLPTPPPPSSYPLGFFSWSITGFAPAPSVTIQITSPVPLFPQSHYFKLVGGTWVSIPVIVSGNKMNITITDNGPFDGNPVAGTISDPGAITNPTNGRITGGGSIGSGIEFGFEVKSDLTKTKSIKGELEYHDKLAKLNLHSENIAFLSVDTSVSQATFLGSLDLDKTHKGYSFITTISDPDKKGDHDTFSITVTDNTGKVIYQKTGNVKGHIEIHKFVDKDDKSDSGINHNNDKK